MNRAERRAVMRRYRKRPDLFAQEILGVEFTNKQTEVAFSVRDNPRTAVRACHGVGKTFTAAVIILWFLYCHPNSRVVTTAPIFEQVKNLLWAEIRGLHAQAEVRGTPLGGKANTTDIHLAPKWFAIGLSTNQPVRFQGHHARHMLFVGDEAAGIAQEIFDAAEGFLTSDDARTLLIGNPNEASGQLYDAFHKEADLWNGIHMSALECPTMTEEAVSAYPALRKYMIDKGIPFATEPISDATARALVRPKWVADKIRKWGTTGPLWDVRVAGNFPGTAVNTVFGLQELQDAKGRVYEPKQSDTVVVAVDVARYGDDETVIGIREGWRFRVMSVLAKVGVEETAGAVIDAIRRWERKQAKVKTGLSISYVVVDDAGVGGGVTDILEDEDDFEHEVRPFNGGHRPRDKKDYPNARSEAWFYLKEHITEVDLDDDAQLEADLLAPTWKLKRKGQREVEEKELTKKRLKRSPDRADCCLMAYYPVRALRKVHVPKRSLYE